MATFIESLVNQFGDDAISMIAGQLGANKQQTSSGLQSMIPIIVKALSQNASNTNGAESLHKAIVEDHNGSILNDLSGFLGGGGYQQGPGDGILKHVLGGNRSTVEGFVSQFSGLSPEATSGLMKMAAPIIMGYLGKQAHSNNMGINDLSGFLNEAQQAESNKRYSQGDMSIFERFLDRDNDGKVSDDVMGMAAKFIGSYMVGSFFKR